MEDPINKKPETRSGIAASGLVSGGVAVGLALFMAATSNSLSLWADWIATLLDFLAVFMAWWGLVKSETRKSDNYQYGFGRYESLVSMAMAALMAISFFCITAAASVRFFNPVPIQGLGVVIGIILHVIFGGINGRLLIQSLRLERREKTALVTAQRRVFAVKASANILMFATLAVAFFFREHHWALYADPLAALFIACMLLASATKMLKFSVRDLLDCALEERSQLLILRALTLRFDQYEQVHEIRTRISGRKVYVEIFLEFSPEIPHGQVMETVRSLSEEIRKLIHCDEVLIIPV